MSLRVGHDNEPCAAFVHATEQAVQRSVRSNGRGSLFHDGVDRSVVICVLGGASEATDDDAVAADHEGFVPSFQLGHPLKYCNVTLITSTSRRFLDDVTNTRLRPLIDDRIHAPLQSLKFRTDADQFGNPVIDRCGLASDRIPDRLARSLARDP